MRCVMSCEACRRFIQRRHHRPAPGAHYTVAPSCHHQHHEAFFWSWRLQVKHYTGTWVLIFPIAICHRSLPIVPLRSNSVKANAKRNSRSYTKHLLCGIFLQHVYAYDGVLCVCVRLVLGSERRRSRKSQFSHTDDGDDAEADVSMAKKKENYDFNWDRSTAESGAYGNEKIKKRKKNEPSK